MLPPYSNLRVTDPKQMAVCGIYKLTSPSGKIYIGQSIRLPKRLTTGILYKSIVELSEKTGIAKSTLHGYINGKTKKVTNFNYLKTYNNAATV